MSILANEFIILLLIICRETDYLFLELDLFMVCEPGNSQRVTFPSSVFKVKEMLGVKYARINNVKTY